MDIKKLVLTAEALNLIDNGTWIGDLPGAPGVEFLVVGMRSTEVRKALEAEQVAVRADNAGSPLTAEQTAGCMERVLASHVLKDWKGLTDNGVEVPYSKELATKWLTSREGEKFAELVLLAVNRLDRNANDFVEVAAKN